MHLYKSVRKQMLKWLNKDQKKQFKGYVEDLSDEMLKAYSETVRLNGKALMSVASYLPIKGTSKEIHIIIELKDI